MTITNPGYIPNVSALVSLATSDWANNVRDRLVQNFSSVAQRDTYLTSPIVGQYAVTTDTMTTWQYVSATTGWTKPWSQPWGIIGIGQATTAQGSITGTYVLLTGMGVTFTAVANRTYEVHVEADILSTVATDTWNMAIANASATLLRVNAGGFVTTNSEVPASVTLTTTTPTTAGSYTFQAYAKRSVGTGTLTVPSAASIQPNQLVVKDVGPNGAPV